MKIDSGSYNVDPESYHQLVSELYDRYPNLTLPPEYTYFAEKDLLRLLIRLARYKFVARLIKKTDSVLEVGSGSGLGTIFLGQHCAQVTGIEVKKTEVEEALSIPHPPSVDFVQGDLFDLPPSRPYDVVVALDVIEHMPVEQGHDLVRAMAERIKPTGMLVIGTPSVYSYEFQGPLSRASHVKCYDQPELVDLIEHYFGRTLAFSMNDELVHTGYHKMAWYYFVVALAPTHGRS